MAEALFDDAQVAAIVQEYEKIRAFLGSSDELRAMRDEAAAAVAPTPRDLLYRENSVAVYRYKRTTPATHATPLLVVPSLVNRPWIMDMLPGESYVQAMLDRGFDVYILEWGEPNAGQKELPLHHYLATYLDRAVRRVRRRSGAEKVSLAGYCLGGTFSLLYAALDKGRQVRNLVSMVAPVNFKDRGMLSWWAHEDHFDVDGIVDRCGNIPAEFFSSSFPWLVPTGKLRNIRTVMEKQQDREFMKSFMALDVWITDQVDFPGEVYRDLIKNGYQRNCLVTEGAWPMGDGVVADMAEVTLPVLSLAATFDHVAPPESCSRIAELVASDDVEAHDLKTGHLGFALGKTGRGLPTTEYWDMTAAWLAARDG